MEKESHIQMWVVRVSRDVVVMLTTMIWDCGGSIVLMQILQGPFL